MFIRPTGDQEVDNAIGQVPTIWGINIVEKIKNGNYDEQDYPDEAEDQVEQCKVGNFLAENWNILILIQLLYFQQMLDFK